jgi:hypothetical protein
MIISKEAKTASRWAALGTMLNVRPARGTPDLERLLLDTARTAGSEILPFTLAVTWLAAYGDLVARHRLANLIRYELEKRYQPAMGILLESAVHVAPRLNHHLRIAVNRCTPMRPPRPLLKIDQANGALWRLAQEAASSISRRWGLWLEPIELKTDALRPPAWLAGHHPALALRALVGGDLVASILAEALASGPVFQSEVELAARCGASRPALRDALAKLRLAGLAKQQRIGRRNQIRLRVRATTVPWQ